MPPLSRQLGSIHGLYEVREDGCWQWLGHTDNRGYGLTRGELYKVDARAHRAVMKLLGHHVPKGAHVHHRCKTTGCVNPDHLEVTTATEHFMEHKLHEKTGLTLDDIKAIRERGKVAGVSAADVAADYGIHEITVYEYWSANHWAELLGGHVGKPVRTCLNCGNEFSDRQRHAKFCKPSCRSRFNGRRAYRLARGLDPDAPSDLRRAA